MTDAVAATAQLFQDDMASPKDQEAGETLSLGDLFSQSMEGSEGEEADADDPEAMGDDSDESDDDSDADDVTDPDDGDEPDADDEDDGEDGDDDDSTLELDLGKKVVVKVDGEDKEVPLKEALEGYIRTETFHKRLNQLNEAKGIILEEAQKVAVNRETYAERLDALTQQLDSLAKEPDWNALIDQDPKEAMKQRLAWDNYTKQRAALEDEKKRVASEKQQEQIEQTKNYVINERRVMVEKVPEWQDAKVRARDLDSMRRTALAAGFRDEEVDTLYDHRMMIILRKAAKLDRIEAKSVKANKPKGGNRFTKPGAGASRTAPKVNDRGPKPLARMGSDVDSAAAAFQGILNLETRRNRRR